MIKRKKKLNSELRQDLVSGNWIIVSPARARRPHEFKRKTKRKSSPVSSCPFEDPQKTGHGAPYIMYSSGKDSKSWDVQVINNKFPALVHKEACSIMSKVGPYNVMDGIGYHDIVISRDHKTNFAHLEIDIARKVFRSFKDRYNALSEDPCISFVSIFHNWGPAAGASIYHPHYQIIALPITPPDVSYSLEGSRSYFHKNKKCVHCEMIGWEKKEKSRIIYENQGAIAFAPFVSKESFEVRVYPKKHLPYFEDASETEIDFVVQALQHVLKNVEKNIGDPDYNFFIHTAPIKNKKRYDHYHWHIEVLPAISISAGFEIETGIIINQIDPDIAAKILRK